MNELKYESLLCSKGAHTVAAGFAWMFVLLAASHRSEYPVVLGLYSWRYAGFLAAFVIAACIMSLTKPSWLGKLWQARTKILISGASLLLTICLAEMADRWGNKSDQLW